MRHSCYNFSLILKDTFCVGVGLIEDELDAVVETTVDFEMELLLLPLPLFLKDSLLSSNVAQDETFTGEFSLTN